MKRNTYIVLGLLIALTNMQSARAQTTVNTLMKCTTTPNDTGEYSKLRIFKNTKDQMQGLRVDLKKDAPPQRHFSDAIELYFDSPVELDDVDAASSDPRALIMAGIAGIILKIIDQNDDLEQMRKISRVKFGNAIFSDVTPSFALIEIFDRDGKSLGTVLVDEKENISACR